MMKRRLVLGAGAAASLAAIAPHSFAQQGNVIKFCVPFPAGGLVDVIARMLGDSMGKTLKRNVIVENRVGAGGVIGSRYVRSAAPDGATIMLHQSGFVATPVLSKVPAYDPVKDFSEVAMIGQTPNFLVVHQSVPSRTLAEFITYVRALPNPIECGNPGTNTGGHICALMFEKLGKLKVLHVPFKGSSEMATAILSGEIKMQITSQSDAVAANIKSGKLRVLGVATSKRSALAPEIPAIAEVLPGYGLDGWYGVLAPAGTPLAVRETLSNAIRIGLDDPVVRQHLASLYMEPGWRGPADFTKVVASSVDYYRRLAEEFHLELQ